jgi:putative oxidoreductase
MDFLAPYRPQLLSVMRIAVALVFLEVPSAKFLGVPHIAQFDGLSPLAWPAGIAGVIETVFGLLLLFGLFGRVAAFILSGEMAFAYFLGHASRGFFPLLNMGLPAVVFCFVFLYLAAAGPGPWSVDAALNRKPATN